MVKQMRLKGQVRLNMDHTFDFMSTLYDGTPFEIRVAGHDIDLMDDFTPGNYVVDGWLYVIQEGQQENRCYCTLPKPSIVHGRQVLVRDLQLQPRMLSIDDFRPQTVGGNVKEVRLEKSGQITEVAESNPGAVVAKHIEKQTKEKNEKKARAARKRRSQT